MEYYDCSNTIGPLIDEIAPEIARVYVDGLLYELGKLPELDDECIEVKSRFNAVTNEVDYRLMGCFGDPIWLTIVRIKLPMNPEVPTDDELNNELKVVYEEMRDIITNWCL